MPEEPKQPIEELLEAHAMKRRAEGGFFELHEATRRLLHGEALRIHGKPVATEPEAPKRSAWFLLWTRLAGAFGVIALLGVAALVIHQTTPAPEREMARLELAERLASPAQRLADYAGEPSADGLNQPGSNAGRMVAFSNIEAPAPSAGSAPVQPAPLPEPARRQTETRSAAPLPAAPRPAVAVSTPMPRSETAVRQPDAPAAKATALAAPALAGTVFRRVDQDDGLRRNLQSPALPNVLSRFSASVLGNRLRIEEADGSVYLGDIAAGGASFSVTGTNRSTGLVVRFMGRATLPVAPKDGPAGALADVPSVLEGTVALGDRQQWRLRAEAQP